MSAGSFVQQVEEDLAAGRIAHHPETGEFYEVFTPS